MLVPWWWLVIVGMVTGSLGLLIGACCSASKRSDGWEEVVIKVNGSPSKICPACGDVAGYGRNGWTCTNPVCEWMEQFEEG